MNVNNGSHFCYFPTYFGLLNMYQGWVSSCLWIQVWHVVCLSSWWEQGDWDYFSWNLSEWGPKGPCFLFPAVTKWKFMETESPIAFEWRSWAEAELICSRSDMNCQANLCLFRLEIRRQLIPAAFPSLFCPVPLSNAGVIHDVCLFWTTCKIKCLSLFHKWQNSFGVCRRSTGSVFGWVKATFWMSDLII